VVFDKVPEPPLCVIPPLSPRQLARYRVMSVSRNSSVRLTLDLPL
jgi:hypothetical protein